MTEEPRALIARQRALAEQYGRRDAAVAPGRAAAAERGRWFNGYLAELLRLHGIDAHSDQRGLGQRDEIDVYFPLGANSFLVENKWTTMPVDVTPVAKLVERLSVRPAGTFGVLLSMAGYTREVTDRARREADILLLERGQVEACVAGVLDPVELFESLLEHTRLRGGGLAPLAELLRPVKSPELPRWVLADAPDAPTLPPGVEYAAPGAGAVPLIATTPPWFSPWTGMAASGKDLLLTWPDGIARVDPATGKSRWEHALPGCHGPAVSQGGALLAVCGHGVLALGPGAAVAAVGGPLDHGARLLPGADQAYAFATTGPPTPAYRGSHLLTRLGDGVGRDETLRIDYVGDIRQVALLPGGRLYLASGYHAGVVEIGPAMALPETQWMRAAPVSEPGALLALDEHRLLTAGRDSGGTKVELYVTDLRTGEHDLLLRLAARFPKALIRAGRPGAFYLLLDVWGAASAPCAMLLELTLPV